ncbi:hypothetical protein [Rhizobacter sp. Root1221]|uniref:hypothetical protein n=1 Tax=Rhizobacter sp. Root1221 TaxID=1736433 RepID=UPI0006FB81BB|nr:hypothetical protein [Rhizobacter sp. Root1221]KQV90156.1 hypothetical protein ASC87_28440 [Rhizobacter sp. Root1221]
MASSAQLTALARQLGTLEQQRSQLQASLGEVEEARWAAARGARGARSRNEINHLQDRVDHARDELQQLLARRDAQADRLDRSDRQLASCERSLAGLSLASAVATGTPTPPSASAPSGRAAEPAGPAPVSAEEAAARRHLQQLERQREALKLEQDRLARSVLAPARAEVQRLRAEAEEILEPTSYMERIESSVPGNLNSYLDEHDLPPMDVPRSGRPDNRHERYLEYFTEAGAGARRFKAAYLVADNAAFSAASALYGSMTPNVYVNSLLWRVLQGHMDDVQHGNSGDLLRRQMEPITAALRSGAGEDALKAAVARQVRSGFDSCMFDAARLASINVRHGGAGPRRARLSGGGTVPTRDVVVTAVRNETLWQLQEVPGHREAILKGAVTQAAAIMSMLAEDYADAMAEVAQAQGTLDEAQKALRLVVAQGVAAAQEFNAVRQQVNQFASERRRLDAPEANKDAKFRSEAVPQIETASTSSTPDPEARGMKLRGDIQGHQEAADEAKQQIAGTDDRIRQAKAALRRCEDQLETAAADHARNAAGGRRQFDALGEQLASLRGRMRPLDQDIQDTRTKLRSHSTSTGLVSERAWDRAVERHLLLDDAALRARARETGYAGVYGSHADMALAVAEINAHVSHRSELQGVLSARTRAEFDRAINALPGGVGITDAVFEHGRPVGRGFSNAPDRTGRPTPLTQSSYSLDFGPEGHVVVSHLYPRAGR